MTMFRSSDSHQAKICTYIQKHTILKYIGYRLSLGKIHQSEDTRNPLHCAYKFRSVSHKYKENKCDAELQLQTDIVNFPILRHFFNKSFLYYTMQHLVFKRKTKPDTKLEIKMKEKLQKQYKKTKPKQKKKLQNSV